MGDGYYSTLSERFETLVSSVVTELDCDELAEVRHYLNHDEFGAALFYILAVIVEQGQKPSRAILEQISWLVDRMEIRDDLPELPFTV